VREGGIVTSQAVLIAVGIDWDGRRQILAVEMANRESRSSWKDFLLGLRERGLSGVELVAADDHRASPDGGRSQLPNSASCCRLVRALAVEMHENWLEAHRYLNMDDLKEHKKAQLRQAA
jgi:transposase-like protein